MSLRWIWSWFSDLLDAMGFHGWVRPVVPTLVVTSIYLMAQLPAVRRWWRSVRKRIRNFGVRIGMLEREQIRELEKHRISVEDYFTSQLAHFRRFCEFGFDINKDYLENCKEIIESKSTRDYRVRPRRKPLKHRDVIELLKTPPLRSEDGTNLPFAIVGEAACGKTVEMMKMFAVLAHDWVSGRPIPILLFVNALGEQTRRELYAWTPASQRVDLKSIVCSYLRGLREDTPVPVAFISLLESRWDDLNPVLLFDAVDECPDRQQYANMADALAAAGRQPSSPTIVVSCREKDYVGGDQFVEIRILELTSEQMVEHFLHHQRRWPEQCRQVLTKEEIEREMAPSHPMANYLSNVYFLNLYLQARAARHSPSDPAPSSVSTLFRKMFLREVSKASGVGRLIENGLPYFEDVMSRVAHTMTESVLKRGSAETGALSISSREFLGALLEPLQSSDESGWRHVLREHLSTPSALPGAGAGTASQLTGLLSSGSDVPFRAFTSQLVGQPSWGGRSVGWLACATISWSQRFGFPLPTVRSERKELRRGFKEEISRHPEDRPQTAALLALTFRAIAWAIDAGILRYDLQTGKILIFRHQRIREYLTACHIERCGPIAFLRGASVDNAWWQETIYMLAAVTAHPREMMAGLLGPPQPAAPPLGHASNAQSESYAWRVLVGARSSLFLPMARRLECQEMVEVAHRRLVDLSLEPITQDKPHALITFKIWATEDLDRMLANGVMTDTGTLVRGLVAGLREPALEKAALQALVTLLQAVRLGLLDWLRGLGGVLYGVLARDPESAPRRAVLAPPLWARRVLNACCRSGWVIRNGAWFAVGAGIIACLMLAIMGRVSLQTWWFVPSIVLLGGLLWDCALRGSRSMADTIFRWLLYPPAVCLVGCFRASVAAVRWLVRSAEKSVVALGKWGVAFVTALGRAIRKLPEWTLKAMASACRALFRLGVKMANGLWDVFRAVFDRQPPEPAWEEAKQVRSVSPIILPHRSEIPKAELARPELPKPELPEPELPKLSLWERCREWWHATFQRVEESYENMVASLLSWWWRSWLWLLRTLIIIPLAVALLIWVMKQAPTWREDWNYQKMRKESTEVKAEALTRRDSRLALECVKLERELDPRIASGPMDSIIGLDRIKPQANIESLEAGIAAWSKETDEFRPIAEKRLEAVQTYVRAKEPGSSLDPARLAELRRGLADAKEEVERLSVAVRGAEQVSARLKGAMEELAELRRLVQARDQLDAEIKQPGAQTVALSEKLAELRTEIGSRVSRFPVDDPRLQPFRSAYGSVQGSLTRLQRSLPPAAPPKPTPVVAVNRLPEAFITLGAEIRKARQQAEGLQREYDGLLGVRRLDESSTWDFLVGSSGWLEKLAASSLTGRLAALEARLGDFNDSQSVELIPAVELRAKESELATVRRVASSFVTNRTELELRLGEAVPSTLKHLETQLAVAAEMVRIAKEMRLRLEKAEGSASQTLGRVVLLQDKIKRGKPDALDWWRRNEDPFRSEFKTLQVSVQHLRKEVESLRLGDADVRVREASREIESLGSGLASIVRLPESLRGSAMSDDVLNPKREAIKALVASVPRNDGGIERWVTRQKAAIGEIESKMKPIDSDLWKGWWKVRRAALEKLLGIVLPVGLLGVVGYFSYRRFEVGRALRKFKDTPALQRCNTALDLLKTAKLEFVRQAIVQYVENLRLKTPEDEERVHHVREELERRGSSRYRQTIGGLARIAADIRKRILHGG